MKRLMGIFIVSQTILFGVLIYQIQNLSDSIKEAASFVATKEGTLSWGGNIPKVSVFLLSALMVLGLFLILSKNKSEY